MFESVKNFICVLHFSLATLMKKLGSMNPSYGASLFIAILSFLNIISLLMIVATIFRLDVSNAATVNFLWCIILYYFCIILFVYLIIKNKAKYSSRIKKFNRKNKVNVMRYIVIGWVTLSIILLPLSSIFTDFLT